MKGRFWLCAGVCAVAALMAAISAEQADAQSAVAATAANSCGQVAALRHREAGNRYLTSVQTLQLYRLCKTELWLQEKVRLVRTHRLWTAPRYHFCWDVPNKTWRHNVCRQRAKLRRITQKVLPRLSRRIVDLAAPLRWGADIRATQLERDCIASHETPGSSHPYTQQQLQGGDYWGKYQYDPGSWQTALAKAQAYYGVWISSAQRADLASPRAQEVVTAFAVAHPDIMTWKPWAYCY